MKIIVDPAIYGDEVTKITIEIPPSSLADTAHYVESIAAQSLGAKHDRPNRVEVDAPGIGTALVDSLARRLGPDVDVIAIYPGRVL